MQVRDGDGPRDGFHGQVVGLTDSRAGFQPAAGEDDAEGFGIMAATATRVESGGAAEFRGHDDERFVETLFLFEVFDECGECRVEFANESVLLKNAFIVDVPPGSVDEVEIVRDFDESDAGLSQSPGQKAALTKLAAIGVAEIGGFLVEVEDAIELRTGQALSGVDGVVVVADAGVFRMAVFVLVSNGGQQSFSPGVSLFGDLRRAGQPPRSGLGVGQINVRVLGSKESGPAGDVGVSDENVRGDALGCGFSFVSDDGADRGIDDRAGGGPAGVESIRGGCVLVDYFVMNGSENVKSIEHLGAMRKMFADARARDGGLD